MRFTFALIVSAFAASLVSGIVLIELAFLFAAGGALLLPGIALLLFIVAETVVYAMALAASARTAAIGWIALAAVGLLVAALFVIEAVALVASRGDSFARDMPIVVEMLVPGLIAAAVQWWFMHREARSRGA